MVQPFTHFRINYQKKKKKKKQTQSAGKQEFDSTNYAAILKRMCLRSTGITMSGELN
jgi:hypothetical protein